MPEDSPKPKAPFWQWVFCEADGTASLARVVTGLVAAFVLGWDTAYIVLAWTWNTRHLASGQTPLPLLPDSIVLAGQAAFITVMYGTNRFFTRRSEQ
jgi:hypothetical protein